MDMDNTQESRGLAVWKTVLGAALQLPGARIERAQFLRTALGPHVQADVISRAIELTPSRAGIEPALIARAAEASCKWHRVRVSGISAATGLPGGWWLFGTVPVDLAQYFWHVVVLAQKLAYLHGWPDLFQEDREIDDETKLVLTLFVGASLGAEGAANALNKLAAEVSKETLRRLPRAPLTKYAIYQVAKYVAKWMGIRLTKKKFAELVGRAIPLVGGAVAGGVTWYAYGSSSERLLEHLRTLPLAQQDVMSTAGSQQTG